MRKRIMSILLSVLLVVLYLPLSGETVKAAVAPSKMANLVLFISFSDTETDYWNLEEYEGHSKLRGEEIYDLYNVTESGMGTLSVKDYFSLVSCGKFEIENIMPQMTGEQHTIVPITLDKNTEYYNSGGEYSLLKEAAEQLNQNGEWLGKLPATLDYDGNGFIDNVTFLVASPETDRDTNFYSHKADAAGYGISINGTRMNCYNIINYGRLHSVSGGAGVAAHEFLHVLGPLDTYKICVDGTGTCGEGPVGCWDIMAECSYRVQYPLAHTRQELGWIDIEEAPVSGTYTLTSPQSDSNHYAMILKTPYSDTEFFVVEYRKKGSIYPGGHKDKIDAGIGESGIIVYRVNLAAEPKSNLASNYIYVFRQGEEEAAATKAEARNAYLSSESGRTAFGSGVVSETSSTKAITYTDGTNSGIIIRNVGTAGGDTITFDLEYSIDMNGRAWDSEQYQYAPIQNGIGLHASILNGTLYGSNMKIVSYNGKLYGLSSNSAGRAELYSYTNGSWKSVKVLTPNHYSYDMDLEVGADGLLYIVCVEEDTGLRVYSMNASGAFSDLTSGLSLQGSVANPKITLTSAGVAVAYRDWRNGEVIRAYLRKGTTWQALNTNGISGNDFQICGRGNDCYLTAIRGSGNCVYYCNVANTSAFTKLGQEFTNNSISIIDLIIDKYGVLYVSYYDTVQKAVLVQGYQNGVWKQLGMNVYSSMVSSISMEINDSKLYVAYQGENLVGIKSHAILSSGGATQTIPIQAVNLDRTSISMRPGETTVLQAFVYPQNTTQSTKITWSSSNSGVASVDSNGKITAKAAGTASITAQTVNGLRVICTVRVSAGGTAAAPYTPTEAFVARLYTMCLGREPEAAGLAYWNQVLVSRKQGGAQVGYGFVFSEEYENKQTSDGDYIEMLYQVFMNRPSDTDGKNYWLGILDQGVSREYVYRGFSQSQEYSNICNSYGIERGAIALTQARDKNPNLTAFVNRIYEKAMERNGEEDGLNYWCGVIQRGSKTPVQVAEYFITSEEFRNKRLSNEEYVKVLYRTFMGRECDQGGLSYWLGELSRGCSREDVLHRFANCPEFKNIMSQFGL
ncbi:MAG: DUF4214 domain-containing protein [Bacteroides sp.]|nr:DUF4214 domain-containing protein [Bacteroides sp.]MCM1548403.1 DUF4214 domain-containing protein [Clostridium sp.]